MVASLLRGIYHLFQFKITIFVRSIAVDLCIFFGILCFTGIVFVIDIYLVMINFMVKTVAL